VGKLIILFGGLLTGLLLSGCTTEESTEHDVHQEEVAHDAMKKWSMDILRKTTIT
jgi:hypothetical protein